MPLECMGWIEEKQIGDNLLWTLFPASMITALDLLLEDRLKGLHKTHICVVHRLMTFLLIRHMRKESGLFFTIPVSMPFWGLE